MAVLTPPEGDRRDGGAADGPATVFGLLQDELDAVAVRVYQLRVTHPTDLVSQLAARAGYTAGEVAEAERLLSRLGLLQPSPTGGWVAVSPESAAENLLAPLEQDVLQRRIAMAATREQLLALSGDYLEARSMRSARSSIEIVEGLDNIRAVIDDLARTCADSLDALIPGGAENEAAVAAAKPLDLELLSRGVRVRSLFQHAARRHRVMMQYVETISSAGAETRSVSVLPSRMLIYDGACALLPLDPLDTSAGAAVVRDPAVLSFLSRLFEHCWAEGTAFSEVEPSGRDGTPSGLEREVLVLMAGGRTNEEIAQRLGVSQRSVSRIVAGLMTRLGATNRFQAGVRAALSGWLV
ncbi:helix-turn-helix domain-containing protein [Streptomyces specialis]|uniref:helix-turn-helix domain-containing protein n=1 Tax=Streptomyces specialis TaxID=498367 RepID=UPI00073F31BE|nr:helix-turn-helix transcriptional regulator [Streptomyces specialis]